MPFFRRSGQDASVRVPHPSASITVEMCERVVKEAEHTEEQPDGRLRFWGYVPERRLYLRVVTSGDREVLLNAFFDGNFTRKQRRSL